MTTKTPSVVPRSVIADRIVNLRETRIQFNTKMVERDKAIAAINDKFTPQLEQLAKSADAHEAYVLQWAEDNRATEFGEAKSLTFDSGAKIQFRTGNKQVVFVAGKDDKKIITAMKRRRLLPFIKVTETLNRAAIASSWGTKLLPEKLAKAIGLRLDQKETVSLDVPLNTAGKEQA